MAGGGAGPVRSGRPGWRRRTASPAGATSPETRRPVSAREDVGLVRVDLDVDGLALHGRLAGVDAQGDQLVARLALRDVCSVP